MSLVIAVGPFTISEDLEYAPLAALLAVCRQRKPDVLVLLGPFVDAEHPLLALGNVDLTFEDIFEFQVGIQEQSMLCRTYVNCMCPDGSWIDYLKQQATSA